MKTYTVNVNGKPVKVFIDEAEARNYMLYLVNWQDSVSKSLAYVDEAVLKSDMRESKEILKHIMEMK
jgi:hypothetical protein